ncbi:uncharacterized protein SEPMUDRAFT_129635 [Sphaerulina musiva SO2202]|uniref:Hydrophobin n=1 Tax=Sphaerulina musiva (strain SO2202) TaxID=692275 RepID=N1QLS4_SPHMS|nr:uncharacterized protein SEPMUDRAFT_129635 [Sphaerulina musiva SO2202]EMF16753.1 hypothetical protein SEPMUDRAFT_129635 [Sphaerulina musiva SO2202]
MKAFRLLSTILIASVAAAIQLPDLQPFLAALPNVLQDLASSQTLQNETAHELLKRQSNGCPNNFRSCSNLGAPSLCCISNAVCSADTAGHVACCPSGAACTGTIAGVITAGTVNSNGALVTGTTSGALAATGLTTPTTTSLQMYTTSASNGLVLASSTTDTAGDGGFIVAGTSTVATPGSAAMRNAEIPLIAKCILRLLDLLPL